MEIIIYPKFADEDEGTKELVKLAGQGNVQAKLDIIMRNQKVLQLLLKELKK